MIFIKMLTEKHFTNYEKLKYKYGDNFASFLSTLEKLYYRPLPLSDFHGENIVFIENHAAVNINSVKLLLKEQNKSYGIKAAEDEIISTSAIESIDFNRNSVRNILRGLAPKDEEENRIAGFKKGFDFISDPSNKITEENLHKLYMMTIGDFLPEEEKPTGNNFYRHDTVYIVSDRIEHTGFDHKKIPQFMNELINFANTEDGINDLIKAVILHFYIAYIHPYFDGNGRIARLLHLWYLVQRGYQSTLFISFSSRIEKTRKAYYDAFSAVEKNQEYSGKIDVTPFVMYFVNNVYNNISENTPDCDTLYLYETALKSGKITEKETQLWSFVLSYYGTEEFSTKQLEKDFGKAAYATIRDFVLKFQKLGLLSANKYGARTKYKIVC